jgi:1-deoxy-D-xylulose-5-phosphate reductoisomerase
MKKSISILGSTGSIGINTLKILKKKKLFKINILAANKNYKLICKQIIEFRPNIFLINDLTVLNKVKKKFKKSKIRFINILDFENKKIRISDITIAAIPGIAGLKPTIELTKKSKKILIANKESIICGWNLIKKAALNNNTKIVPVDSEHFSIMKLLENQKTQDIEKIYLTASGGPFLNYNLSKMKKAGPSLAIKHPKWKMGKKISIDSATMMNKILEVIEAQKIFSLDLKKIDIIIHPESLIHAIIKLKNGIYKFIYHETTMMIPLANAIFDNNLNINDFLRIKDKAKQNFFFNNLNFLQVDKKKFPVIKLKHRISEFHSTPIIINAVNEILVDQYLKKRIPFMSFFKHISGVLNDSNYKKYAIKVPKNIDQIFLIDEWARKTILKKINH